MKIMLLAISKNFSTFMLLGVIILSIIAGYIFIHKCNKLDEEVKDDKIIRW